MKDCQACKHIATGPGNGCGCKHTCKECEHDYDNPKRLGRAHYICRKCKKNLTMELVLMHEADQNDCKSHVHT